MNVIDAEDAHLDGKAVFEDWLDEFQEQWERPAVRTMAAASLGQLPPEVIDQLAEMNPDGFAKIVDLMEGGKYKDGKRTIYPRV